MDPSDSLLNALAGHPAASPHARQLRQGFRWLRFEPALEAEFRAELTRDLERRLRVIAWLSLTIWAGFAMADALRVRPELLDPRQLVLWDQLRATRLGVLTFLVLCTAWLWVQRSSRGNRTLLVIGALLVEWGGAFGTTCYLRLQIPVLMEVLLLLVASLFLPLGLTVRQTAALAAVSVFGIAGVGLLTLSGAMLSHYLYFCWLAAVTALLAGFGAYFREHAQRQQFLLQAELGWQATHDYLTNLANRRLFGRELERLLRAARRDSQPLALVLLDVDWFKRFNDLYGHPAGDDALQQIAGELAAAAARPLDLAARLGGEELALLLYGADAAAVQRHCEALLARVRDLRIPHADAPNGRLTVSLGCAMARPGDSGQALYQRADALLYEAKQQGRDRAAFEAATTPS
ncbi:MAG: GGDEF domain-containing protein [Burkholderiales bacterium]|uniref:GGDEF domain-containing protein n=1 Tax=Inhella sp. TaxID=1921806 RepID=UPI001ACFD37C|nr:GGDEF domain-containing protein [Burkholderiales bacterium]